MRIEIAKLTKDRFNYYGSGFLRLRSEQPAIGWKEICQQFHISPEAAKKIYRKYLKDNNIEEPKSGRGKNNTTFLG